MSQNVTVPSSTNRVFYLDFLRIIASLSVIAVHVNGQNMSNVPYTSREWAVFNVYGGMVRWGVPIFTMISGTLFLSGNSPFRKILRKNVVHVICALVVWSLIYATASMLWKGSDVKTFILNVMKGYYHMWYLYMIIGLYLLVPFLRKIVDDEFLMKYYLLLMLIFAIIVPNVIEFSALRFKSLSKALNTVNTNLHMDFVKGYPFYFVLGFCLNRMQLTRKRVIASCVIGVLGFICTIWGNAAVVQKIGKQKDIYFYSTYTFNGIATSQCVFILARAIFSNIKIHEGASRLIRFLANHTFGIYLSHALVLDTLKNNLSFTTLTLDPVISVPLITLLVFCLSLGITIVIKRIPVLNKYIV